MSTAGDPEWVECEFGDGWHAIVGPERSGEWSWEVWDQFVHDWDIGPVVTGRAASERDARRDAIRAYLSASRSGQPSRLRHRMILRRERLRLAFSERFWQVRCALGLCPGCNGCEQAD